MASNKSNYTNYKFILLNLFYGIIINIFKIIIINYIYTIPLHTYILLY